MYKKIYGLTGTLGSKKERQFIYDMYGGYSTVIPPFRDSKMKDCGISMKEDQQSWLDTIESVAIRYAIGGLLTSATTEREELIQCYKNIFHNNFNNFKKAVLEYLSCEEISQIKTNIKDYENCDALQEVEIKDIMQLLLNRQRAVLFVCDTPKALKVIEERLRNIGYKEIITYENEGDAHKIRALNNSFDNKDQSDRGAKPGTVIISTNIGGRGTDIKLRRELESNGGLHECTTYLPKNIRTEKQAAGRVARSGEKGSTQIIFQFSELQKLEGLIGTNPKREEIVEEIKKRINEFHQEEKVSEEEKECLYGLYERLGVLSHLLRMSLESGISE